jgi:protoporphyrin/coproporphyrin ferrochelatase
VTDPIGVLVMAYGGPNSLAEVEPYLLDVRGFRPTAPEIVEEVKARYAAIGGRSPILEQTQAQARALGAALAQNGQEYRVAIGMRHWQPRIGEALAQFATDGVDRAVGLVMAPHYSRLSIDLYFAQVERSRGAVEIAPIADWHLLPGYLDAVADRVRNALPRFPESVREQVPVLFTAHSLPQRILEWQDPYPNQLAASVREVMARLGPRAHRFAYQSAALTRDPWLGPDAGTVLAELAGEGHRHVLVAPIGFTCEHVEVLYDVDIELRERAAPLGIQLERIEMVNGHPAMTVGLADLITATARGRGWT